MWEKNSNMDSKITMIYWKGEKFWLGKILEYPEIMTQGESIEELEENLKDALNLAHLRCGLLVTYIFHSFITFRTSECRIYTFFTTL